MLDREAAHRFMRQMGIDAWLLHDYRGSNPLLWQLLGVERSPTRRAMLIVPQEGAPVLLLHTVDQFFFRDIPFEKQIYRGWEEMRALLRSHLARVRRLAVDTSHEGEVPNASFIDGGTLEWLRGCGFDIVSSADLFQLAVAAWDDDALASHQRATVLLAAIKDAAFDRVRSAVRARRTISEYELQGFILSEFERHGLETEGKPVVQVNAHSGIVSYEPQAEGSAPIGAEDWLLIDAWAREAGPRTVYADIAWGGYGGAVIPARLQAVFDLVARARDAAFEALVAAFARGEPVRGFEIDDIARGMITAAGHGADFHHRTGHSIGPGRRLHALGVNLDNLETHDTRLILPRTGFSIEPAVYLPDFGVRLEINVFIDPTAGPIVTTPVQRAIERLV